MKIDWFTIIAQVINFLVLLWLMKRFLYKPVLHAIDEREKRIAEKLANAETEKVAAKNLKEEYDRKKKELEGWGDVFRKKVQDEGKAEKLRLQQEARDAADELSAERREALIEDEKTLHHELRRRIQDQVLAITRKVLADLAGANLEERVILVFHQRLRNLDEAKKKILITALKAKPGLFKVRTGFDISTEQKASTEALIKELLGVQTKLLFETAPELISGIELRVNGQKMAWSVADYLNSIEKGFDDLLQEQGRGETSEPDNKSI